MRTPSHRLSTMHRTSRRGQGGVILLFCLIALIVMLIGSVAMVRSFNTTLFTSGNVAFKRDLQNQSERAVAVALSQVRAGGTLATPQLRSDNLRTSNYSAVNLATNAQGIPMVLLLRPAEFDALWTAAPIAVDDQGVTIRYIIDRLCDSTGLDAALGSARCQIVDNSPTGGSSSHLNTAENASAGGAGASALQIVYRISIRVDGPRDTQAFYQSTFTL